MTTRSTLRFGFGVLAIGAAALLSGCGNDDPGGDDGGREPSVEDDLVFVPGQGQVVAPRLPYPEGPKGFDVGSVIENFRWVGYVNYRDNAGAGMQLIQLADFYNPTGTEVWGPGQVFPEGSPKPKALLLDVASVWCGPCNTEAKSILPGLYELYKPQGGEFLLQLADGPEGGVPATSKNLISWSKKYLTNYVSVLDPAYKLGALFEAEAYPQNFIIDTRTMTIVEIYPGAPEPGGAFWKKFEKVLAGE
jgi:hypothetical protein